MFKHPLGKNKASLSGLQNIQLNLKQQRELLVVVKNCLTEQLAKHCSHLIINKSRVILYTDSSVWASKLLYMRAVIIEAISNHVSDRIQTLSVKVLHLQTLQNENKPKLPSSQTLKYLNEANNNSAGDKLSASMSKLIKALKRNKLAN